VITLNATSHSRSAPPLPPLLRPLCHQQGDERGEFLLEFQRGERLGRPNVWIVKSSHGCKGIGIRMFMVRRGGGWRDLAASALPGKLGFSKDRECTWHA